MSKITLRQLLGTVLGSGRDLKNDEVAFHCPFCNHHKKKLQVNIVTQLWQCWVCGEKGRKLYQLFRKLHVDSSILSRLSNIIGDSFSKVHSKSYSDLLALPNEYMSLLPEDNNTRDPEYINAIQYLKSRGIGFHDIMKYNIGYCTSGPYRKMLIIPSYDENGKLNFFTGRSYYKEATFKHKNPSVSKDIVGFDLHINWNMPINLVEGAFDAIGVKGNTIPLFGKIIQDSLKMKIVDKKVSTIYLILDGDAIASSIRAAEYFMSHNINVYIVNLSEFDPSELGFEKMSKLINKTEKLDFSKLMEYKLYG